MVEDPRRESAKFPAVRCDLTMVDLIHHRLVAAGVGSWTEVSRMPVDAAVACFQWIVFEGQYAETFRVLNTPDTP
jgi:hypothetical protein